MPNRPFDRVIDGQVLGDGRSDGGALGCLLAAAAAPAGRHELGGEDAATAMWRASYRRPAAAVPHRRWTARLTALKIATAGLVLGLGSVALAESAGVLTGPAGPGQPRVGHSRVDSTGGSAVATTAAVSSGRPGQSPGPDQPPTGPGPGLPPTEFSTLARLCDAYAAAMAAGRTNVLDTQAFAPLVTAAGGQAQVASFCAALTPAPTHGRTTPAPHPSPTPSTHPRGGTGNGSPAGSPTGASTIAPTTHPSR